MVTDSSSSAENLSSSSSLRKYLMPLLIMVFALLSISHTVAYAAPFSYESLPGSAITDNSCVNTSIAVNDSFTVSDLDVGLNLSHTYRGDLTVSLIAPDSTTAVLYDRHGGAGDNLDIALDGSHISLVAAVGVSPHDVAAPFYSNEYKPGNDDALSVFNGKSSVGNWVLRVCDGDGGDVGTLNRILLEFTGTVIGGGAQPPQVSKSFQNNNVVAGTESNMTITLSNPNSSGFLSGISFSDTYPTGLINTGSAVVKSNTCGGSLTAEPDADSLAFSGGSLNAVSSCSIIVGIVADASLTGSTIENCTSEVTSTSLASAGSSACASTTVSAAAALDYGDAPASYGDASHVIDSSLYLGSTIPDAEAASQYSYNAYGDGQQVVDGSGTWYLSGDEDGAPSQPVSSYIPLFPVLKMTAMSYSADFKVNNAKSVAATLYGWIDFDQDGVFSADEAATVTVPPNSFDATVNLSWDVPVDIQLGTTFIRLRLTTDSSVNTLTPASAANDGEVEDFALAVALDIPPNSNDITIATDELPQSCQVVVFSDDFDDLAIGDFIAPNRGGATVTIRDWTVNGGGSDTYARTDDGTGVGLGTSIYLGNGAVRRVSPAIGSGFEFDANGRMTTVLDAVELRDDVDDVTPGSTTASYASTSDWGPEPVTFSRSFATEVGKSYRLYFKALPEDVGGNFIAGTMRLDMPGGSIHFKIPGSSDGVIDYAVEFTAISTTSAITFVNYGHVNSGNGDGWCDPASEYNNNPWCTVGGSTNSTHGNELIIDNVAVTESACTQGGNSGVISGVVYVDADSNDSYNSATETALSDITVSLLDHDTGVPITSVNTDASGAYSFDNLVDTITYRVSVDGSDSDLPSGAVAGTPNPLNNLSVAGNAVLTEQNVGFDLLNIPAPTAVGEYRFDDCGEGGWALDSSGNNNSATGSVTVIDDDFKSYGCTSVRNSSFDLTVPHIPAYEIAEGAISVLMYDHQVIADPSAPSRLFSKGWDDDAKLDILVKQTTNSQQGTVSVRLNGDANVIDTGETYFSTLNNGTTDDTQWVHVMFTFGSQGMKLYINGVLKGTNAYTGGMAAVEGAIRMAEPFGYIDEFYILDAQPGDAGVQSIYNNLINNKNLDGSARICNCGSSVASITGKVYLDENGNDTYDVLNGGNVGSLQNDLLLLYRFNTGSGNTVYDMSGVGSPMSLSIADPSKVTWLSGGGLSVDSNTLLKTNADTKLTAALKVSNEVTLEAWVKPANLGQVGPARIATLSQDTLLRNVTLGQKNDDYEARLRTTNNSDNGNSPETVAAGVVKTELQHVVYTRNAAGVAQIYVDGVSAGSETIDGNLSNLSSSALFAVANELTGNRSWLGELYKVAMYKRALSASEISGLYAAGALGGERLLANVTVSLYNDNGTGGTLTDDLLLRSTITASDGSYGFYNVAESLTYRIDVDTADADLPVGATIGTLNPLVSVPVAAGTVNTDQNFGFDAGTGEFTCTSRLYQSVAQPTANSPVQLYGIALNGNTQAITAVGNTSHGISYNAIGYNVLDNRIYGIKRTNQGDMLVTVGSDGVATELGVLSQALGSQPGAGDMDDQGNLYVRVNSSENLFKINVATRVVTEISSSMSAFAVADFAWNSDGLLYGIVSNTGQLHSLNPATGALVAIGDPDPDLTLFGAQFFDNANNLYAIENATGDLYRFDITDGSHVILAAGFSSAAGNDGASCRGEPPVASGMVTGHVYHDDDQSSNYDVGNEVGIGSITVSLYFDNGTQSDFSDDIQVATTESAADGAYDFKGVNASAGLSYRIEVSTTDTDLAGKTVVTTNPLTGVTVTAGNTTANQNFGFALLPAPEVTVVGEYRFDDCGGGEWLDDYSINANTATGVKKAVHDDGKDYGCTSLSAYKSYVDVPHIPQYEMTEGAVSMLVYDHHNTWPSSDVLAKSDTDGSEYFNMKMKRTTDEYHGTFTVDLNGNTIDTGETFFTVTSANDGNLDTDWVHVVFTFGSQGMRLYIDGQLKGANAYTGGFSNLDSVFDLPYFSGYYDEFYILDGQPNDAQVQTLHTNLLTNKNINGSPRTCDCSSSADVGTIKGTVYADDNGNDLYDLGVEDGINAMTVWLYEDNGTHTNVTDDTLIATTGTDTDGSYRFDNVNAELTYRIEVDTTDPDLPANFTLGTVNPLTAVFVISDSITGNQNFGFDITLADRDYGDAPESYGVTLVNNGARHTLSADFHLGATVDAEADGLPGVAADGDGADEDGISFLTPLLPGEESLVYINTTLTNTPTAKLSGWIDFNLDGDFADVGEQVITDQIISRVVPGVNLSIMVPDDAVPGVTYARFRLSTAGGLTYNGSAADGEVEDYQVTIIAPSVLGDTAWLDQNANGIQDAGEPGLEGVAVKLYRQSDNQLLQANFTDEQGKYRFGALPADTYYLEFTPPPGYAFTPPGVGSDANLDSNADTSTGRTENIVLSAGSTQLGWDAGFTGTPDIVTYCNALPYQTTDITHTFPLPKFDSVLGTLTEVEITAHTSVKQLWALENTGSSTTTIRVTSSVPGNFALPDDSTLTLPYSYDSGFLQIPAYDGVTDFSGSSGIVSPFRYAGSTVTQNYLPVSNFIAATAGEMIQLPYTTWPSSQGVTGGGNNRFTMRTRAAAGACVHYIYTPVAGSGTISGTVYADSNSNDSYDAGSEAGIGSVRVSLFSGVNSTLITTVNTASNGAYSFTGLNADSDYRIEVDTTDTDLAGRTIGTINPLAGVAVTAGSTTTDQNFGFDAVDLSCSLVVTTTDDSDNVTNNSGSLRDAIECSNATAGPNTITFDMPTSESGYAAGTGVWTISPDSALPIITDADTTLAADTQTNAQCAVDSRNITVQLSGSNAGVVNAGLEVVAERTLIRGIAVNNFTGVGIYFDANAGGTSGGSSLTCSNIGINAAGTAALGNSSSGVQIKASSNITIGGSAPGDRNIVGGNGHHGINFDNAGSISDVTIQGNYIGVGADGMTDLPNVEAAIGLYNASNITVGGSAAGEGNVLNSARFGVLAYGVTHGIIRGNTLGATADQSTILDFTDSAIEIRNGSNHWIIGGTGANDGNLIVGAAGNNLGGGIVIDAAGNTTVQGNLIGELPDGTPGQNTNNIYALNSAGNVLIGGVNANEGNVIAHATQHGLMINSSAAPHTAMSILGNSIYANADHGIDLRGDGVSTNDTGDGDVGPNNMLNHPIVEQVVQNGANVELSYSLDVPAGNYRIEFFDNPLGLDLSGHGEGEMFVGSQPISHVGAGEQLFSFTLAGVTLSDVANLALTATEKLETGAFGVTSEFSNINYEVSGLVFEDLRYGGGNGRPFGTAGTVGANDVRLEIYDNTGQLVSFGSSLNEDGQDGVYALSVPANGQYYVRAVSDSVSSTRAGSDSSELGVVTFRTDGVTDVIDEVGGHNPALADAGSNDGSSVLDTSTFTFTDGILDGQQAQAVQPVVLATISLEGVSFGFNFNTVVNTSASGQGSLLQFVRNNNLLDSTGITQQLPAAVAGDYASDDTVAVFMIPATQLVDGDAVISPAGELQIEEPQIVIDGRVQAANIGSGEIIIKGDNTTLMSGVYFGEAAENSVLRDVTISNFAGSGITIYGTGSAGAVGVTVQSVVISDNNAYGVLLQNLAVANQIIASTIRDNNFAGITNTAASNNTFSQNSISGNGALGIDLGADGVTANSSTDVWLNYPEIDENSSISTNGSMIVAYDFDLDVPTNTHGYRVEFFSNAVVDSSGHGEGEVYLGYTDIEHDGEGSQNFKGSFTAKQAVSENANVAVTLTEKLGTAILGSTSEFSGVRNGGLSVCTDLLVDPDAGLVNVVIDENPTAITYLEALDADGNPVTYTISGGADSERFIIRPAAPGALFDCLTIEFVSDDVVVTRSLPATTDSTLRMGGAPPPPPGNYEAPVDRDRDNVYDLEVTATDSNGNTVTRIIAVAIQDVNEKPFVTAASAVDFLERQDVSEIVIDLESYDPDADDVEGSGLTYSISGGADGRRFNVDALTGELRFKESPDYGVPVDSNGDNAYVLDVQVTDDQGYSGSKTLTVSVFDDPDAGGVQVNITALLQGAYDRNTGLMHDDLRSIGVLPVSQPYTAAPFNYQGAEALNLDNINVSGSEAVVDWVLVELRSSVDPTQVVATQAALIRRNGNLADINLTGNGLSFDDVDVGQYYISLRHRNHLDVMTAAPVSLSMTAALVDFSSAETVVYGEHGRLIDGDIALLWSGDVNQDNRLILNGQGSDINIVLTDVLTAPGNVGFNSSYQVPGYKAADLNMDGSIVFTGPANDANILLGNILTHPGNTNFSGNFIGVAGMP